jgi:delta 1-pyrroline-5-carboxylate dehydrogenase
MTPSTLSIITPVDSTAFATVQISSSEQVQAAVERAAKAQKAWKRVPLKQRVEMGRRFLEVFGTRKDELAKELTMQMGRPLRYTPGEIKGTQDRGKYMVDVAEEALKDVEIVEAGQEGKFKRFIRKEAVGVVLIVARKFYLSFFSLFFYLFLAVCVGKGMMGNDDKKKKYQNSHYCFFFFLLQIMHFFLLYMYTILA